ncbi:hypothetical protein FA13DRAFT_1801699 [Coprinellus micaceus]|uniref:Uncharacterized protein n=1 Tax=Coprinellus micaceus TaxID=71717 RepID=A0A4Y7SE90_COPMI|nr:hypothetical protein FA13DRAFT_1801699 [Coprinellus micaceus]
MLQSTPKKPKIDYASADRPHTGGPHYRDCAIAALQTAFPLIPLPYLRKKLAKLNGLGGGGGAKGKGREGAVDEVFEEGSGSMANANADASGDVKAGDGDDDDDEELKDDGTFVK